MPKRLLFGGVGIGTGAGSAPEVEAAPFEPGTAVEGAGVEAAGAAAGGGAAWGVTTGGGTSLGNGGFMSCAVAQVACRAKTAAIAPKRKGRKIMRSAESLKIQARSWPEMLLSG